MAVADEPLPSEFRSLNVPDGFTHQPDSRAPIGHLLSLRFTDVHDKSTVVQVAPTLQVTDPLNPAQTRPAVAVLSAAQWDGGMKSPIRLIGKMPLASRLAFAIATRPEAEVMAELTFAVYAYDEAAQQRYLAFGPAIPGLKGRVAGVSVGRVVVSTRSTPNPSEVALDSFFDLLLAPPPEPPAPAAPAASKSNRKPKPQRTAAKKPPEPAVQRLVVGKDTVQKPTLVDWR